MVYTFACPAPCQRVIKIVATTDDDAINNIIVAGALSCRNKANRTCCEKGRHHMPSLSEDRLREIVRFSMESEPVDQMPMMSERMAKTMKEPPCPAGIR